MGAFSFTFSWPVRERELSRTEPASILFAGNLDAPGPLYRAVQFPRSEHWLSLDLDKSPGVNSHQRARQIDALAVWQIEDNESLVALRKENKKASAPWRDESPERLALNSSVHFPLRRTSCVPPVWPRITREAFSMTGGGFVRNAQISHCGGLSRSVSPYGQVK